MHSICVHLRNLWIILFCLLPFSGDRASAGEKKEDAAKPYVETVPGSTVTFAMRPVTVGGRTLWFAETETTWDAYDVFALRLDENADDVAAAGGAPDAVTRPTQPYAPADRGWGHGGFPVISVTHNAATKYCAWLSEKTGRKYRLPAADEFRAAAGAAPEPEDVKDKAPDALPYWVAENAKETTQPVARHPANAHGLHDTLGNVAEWCSAGDAKPLVLGGSFLTPAAELGAALADGQRQTREWTAGDPSFPPSRWWLRDAPFVGFRVVCEEPPK